MFCYVFRKGVNLDCEKINFKNGSVSRLKDNVKISDKELELLELINNLGPCSSEKVHETLNSKTDYLIVMRALHALVEKGFLQRLIINKKQLYRTSRQYNYIRGFLEKPNLG